MSHDRKTRSNYDPMPSKRQQLAVRRAAATVDPEWTDWEGEGEE